MRGGSRISSTFWGLAGIAIFLASWELATRLGAIDPTIFPGPAAAIRSAVQRLPASVFLDNMAWSLFRVIGGFVLGAVAGTVIGFAAGWYRGFGYFARPLIELLRPIPPLAWIPLAIIWFGLGEPSKFFIVFLGGFGNSAPTSCLADSVVPTASHAATTATDATAASSGSAALSNRDTTTSSPDAATATAASSSDDSRTT